MNDNKDYNTLLTVWELRSDKGVGGSQNLISEQTGISMSVSGSMREGNKDWLSSKRINTK